MNDLPILPRIVLERTATDPRDDGRGESVTKAITFDHWATLSRFYVANIAAFRQEADGMWAPRAERMRDKLASLS